MRDDRTATLNRWSVAEARQTPENGGGNELVTPTRWNDARVACLQARMRELNGGVRRGSEQRIRAEDDHRHSLRNGRFGLLGSSRRQIHVVRDL